MRVRVQKWGNSLALRIPKPFAEDVRLTECSEVDVSVAKGSLIVAPVVEDTPTLEELVAGITEENRHPEVDWGSPVGKEAGRSAITRRL